MVRLGRGLLGGDGSGSRGRGRGGCRGAGDGLGCFLDLLAAARGGGEGDTERRGEQLVESGHRFLPDQWGVPPSGARDGDSGWDGIWGRRWQGVHAPTPAA